MQKKHRIISIIALLLMVSVYFSVIPLSRFPVSAVDTSEENEASLRKKLEQLKKDQDEIINRLNEAKNGISDTERTKENLDALATSTQTEIDLSEQLIEEYDGKIKQKEQEIVDMENYIDERFALMMDRLRFSYEDGNATYLALILSADNLSEFLSNSERVESMMEFDESLMNELSVKLKVLGDEKTILQNTRDEQAELKETLIQKKADYVERAEKARAYIRQLQADQEKYDEELRKIEAEEEAASAAIEKIIEERKKTVNAPAATGEYIWPVPGHTWVSSYFGNRTLNDRPNFHRGIDIPAPTGTPIYACNSGTVIKSTWHYSWGNYIVIDHGGGISTLYAHCSRLLVSEGDVVNRGDLIAKVGETGNAYGAHLHLEYMINGKLKNPLNYVGK